MFLLKLFLYCVLTTGVFVQAQVTDEKIKQEVNNIKWNDAKGLIVTYAKQQIQPLHMNAKKYSPWAIFLKEPAYIQEIAGMSPAEAILLYALLMKDNDLALHILGQDNCQCSTNDKILSLAMPHASAEVIKKIFSYKAVNEQNAIKTLSAAIERGDDTILKESLQVKEIKDNINKETDSSLTPLELAIHNQNAPIIKMLIDAGADINQKKYKGNSLLHYENFDQTIQILCKKGLSVDTKNDFGQTPLHVAAKSGNINTIKILIEEGATIDMTDNENKTPLDLSKNIDVKKMLESAESTLGQSLIKLKKNLSHLKAKLKKLKKSLVYLKQRITNSGS